MAEHPLIGKRVRFAPNPRWPMRTIEATVKLWRRSPNAAPWHKTGGWIDTVDDAGTKRSVRPSRCEIVK